REFAYGSGKIAEDKVLVYWEFGEVGSWERMAVLSDSKMLCWKCEGTTYIEPFGGGIMLLRLLSLLCLLSTTHTVLSQQSSRAGRNRFATFGSSYVCGRYWANTETQGHRVRLRDPRAVAGCAPEHPRLPGCKSLIRSLRQSS